MLFINNGYQLKNSEFEGTEKGKDMLRFLRLGKKTKQNSLISIILFCYMKPKSETGCDDEVKEVLTVGSQLAKEG